MKVDLSDLIKGPVLLAPDNFTDLGRTPWAGETIGRNYKRQVVAGAERLRIGEAWEFSCDPDFPSQLAGQSVKLSELVARYPDDILSPHWRRNQTDPHCEILVKLLNADSPLSLQVHPHDDDPDLAPLECGKPESWLILHAEKGAGIYLGFAKPLSKAQLTDALEAGADLRALLNFIEVRENDYFDIAPGVPHAIGGGVTLLEPQRIRYGRSGKTYRLWDWNRTYNSAGALDSQTGKPRPLHIAASLRLIDPERQVGPAFVDSLRRRPQLTPLSQGALLRSFAPNAYYQVQRVTLQQGANVTCNLSGGYGALIVLAGQVEVQSQYGVRASLPIGQPALLPFKAAPFQFTASQDSDVVLVVPSQSRCFWL